MSKTCNGCGTSNQPISVPYIVHESSMVRAERQAKRLIAIIILLIVLLVGSNIGWLIYESQFETVESTIEEYAIEQNAESGNNNSIINGGEIVNGETEDNIQKNNN